MRILGYILIAAGAFMVLVSAVGIAGGDTGAGITIMIILGFGPGIGGYLILRKNSGQVQEPKASFELSPAANSNEPPTEKLDGVKSENPSTKKKLTDSIKKKLADLTSEIDDESIDTIIENMLIMAYADGQASREELNRIGRTISEIWDISSQERIEGMIGNVNADRFDLHEQFKRNNLRLKEKLSAKQKKHALELVVGIAQADKVVTDEEAAYINDMRSQIGIEDGFLGSIVKVVVRVKCTRCQSKKNPEQIGTEEVDRYSAQRKFATRTASGKYKEEMKRVTVVKYRATYQCPDCGAKSSKFFTSDLG